MLHNAMHIANVLSSSCEGSERFSLVIESSWRVEGDCRGVGIELAAAAAAAAADDDDDDDEARRAEEPGAR